MSFIFYSTVKCLEVELKQKNMFRNVVDVSDVNDFSAKLTKHSINIYAK